MFQSNTQSVQRCYKNNFSIYIRFLFILTAIGFVERCFFAIYHNHLSEQLSFLEISHAMIWGIKFDLALAGFFSLVTFLSLYFLKRIFSVDETKVIPLLTYLSGSFIFFIQGGDIIYFSDSARHIGYEITDVFNDAPYLLSTAWSVYKLPFLLHLALYLPLLFLIKYIFSVNSNVHSYKLKGIHSLHYEVVLLISLLVSATLIRGGFQSIPLEPIHAQELSNSRKATLAINGGYNAVFNLLNKDQIKSINIKLPADLDINATLHSMYSKNTNNQSVNPKWKPNIIFILLESWPAMYMKSYGYSKETTPFFDNLRKKSLTTLEMIAGGHRTTEGMFSSLCSTQNPLGQTIAQSQLQNYEYHCLPHVLRDDGYQTTFFQGSNKNTSGTGAFAQLLGFSESYGKADITERRFEENTWGVYDQDLYDYVYQALKDKKSPVLFGINTNTTHDIAIPKTIKPQFNLSKSDPLNLNSLHFADAALKDFFNKVENDKDIGETLWVIVADHTAGLKTSRLNNYRIPFLIYSKNKIQAKLVERIASQRDIAPSILDLLGYDSPDHFTGKFLHKSDNPPYYADYYHSGILGWLEGDLLVEIPIVNSKKASCFYVKPDKIQVKKKTCSKNNLDAVKRSLSFTYKQQTLLFSGNLKNWSKK